MWPRMLLIVLWAFIAPVQSKHVEDLPLKIAMITKAVPYSYLDQNNKPQGLLIDYWRLWAKKVQREVEFVPYRWAEAILALKNNQVDIHMGLLERGVFREYIDILDAIYTTKSHIYIPTNNPDNIENINDLKGKRLGVYDRSFFDAFITEKHPDIEIKRYRLLTGFEHAVDNKEIDAFLSESMTTWFHSISALNFNQYVKLKDFKVVKDLKAAIRKNRPLLKNLVLQGMASITADEMLKIERKWIFREQDRTVSSTTERLTSKERQWLLTQPIIEIGSEDNRFPFSHYNKNGELVGFNIDLIQFMNKNLNTNFALKRYPVWSNALLEVKAGTLSGIFSLSWSEERAQKINFSPVYSHSPHSLIVREKDQRVKELHDLAGSRIAVLEHHLATEILKSKLPNAIFVFAHSPEEAYQMIQNNEADASLFAFPSAEILHQYDLKVADLVYTKAGEFSIGMPKSVPMLKIIMTKAINSLTTKQKNTLYTKWFQLKKHSILTKSELHYILHNPTVVVGIEHWPPIIFDANIGQTSGIIGDFLTEIEQLTGLEFIGIKDNWQSLWQQFNKHKIDLLPATFFSESREQKGLYGDSYLQLGLSLLINSKDNNLKSLADLKGKKLALIEGHYVIEKIKTRFPEIDIVMTSGVSDSVSRLINHEVDAVFGVNSVLSSAKTTSLSKGLELITQNDIKPLPLHFFTEPSKPILHSILNKALTYISQTKKDNIIQHWLGEDELKKTVSIAFGIGSAPYSLTQEPWRGIEYDLIKKIFGVSQIKIESAEDMSKKLLPQQLDTQSQFDVISSVAIQQPQYYYSDKFVTMSNVVVTKKADHFKINSLVDLIDKSVYAFSGALNELGPEYFNVFNPESYKGSYQEYRVQKNQVSDFLLGDVDAMIIDRKIFYWYARINGYSSFENFEFHELFPKEKEFYVGFKQLKLRDIFNKNLAAIKKTGEYQYILDEYNNGTVVPKIKLTSLISAILAPFIFKNNHQAIISLTKKLNSLPYINKIEVYNKHDKLIHATSTQEYRYYKHADSYSFVSKIWTKVGSIKVYFEQNLVVENLGGDDLIPDISFYDDQKEKSHITEVYKNFSYFSNKVNFSTEEKRYIATHPVLKFSEVSWQPLSIVAESGNIGLIFDYLQIFSQKTGIQFELVPADNWPQAVEKFKANEIDFLPGITKLKKYTDIGKISDEYAYFNFSIIMNSDASFADSISDIKGKKIALVNDTSAYHYIKTYYPDAYTVEAHNVTEVLKMIQQGEADVAIGHLAASVYQLENKFSDLKIVGILDSGYSHRVLVQPNNELLLSIFNKVINDIPIEQHRDIRERWMNQKILTAVDYRLVYQIVTGFLLLLFLILLVVKKLTNAKKYVDKTNLELQRTIADLKTTQQHLVESEKMASLGGLVAGVAHEINTPVGIGLTAITHFLSINDELKLKHQQQKISQKYFEKYLKDSTESANIINRNLERTAQLVSSFKRISVDQSSDECRTFPVKKYIDEILLSVNHVIKRSKIDIHISCSDSLKINSHPGAMAQILTNLIINSSIHGFPNNAKGNIFIDITTDQQHVTLTYHDDGCGISGKNLNKIFDPFFTTNREHGGSGLGLNIVYNIVHTRLGGTIMCTSELNEGVKFVIKFDVDIVSQ